jgi:hypothetical protein
MADGVIVHVPASNLLVEADLSTQEWDFNWWGDSLMNNIEYRKIKVDTNLSVHAQKPYPLAEVVSAIERQVRNTQAFCRRPPRRSSSSPGARFSTTARLRRGRIEVLVQIRTTAPDRGRYRSVRLTVIPLSGRSSASRRRAQKSVRAAGVEDRAADDVCTLLQGETLRHAVVDDRLPIVVDADHLLPLTHHTEAALEPIARRTSVMSRGACTTATTENRTFDVGLFNA